MALSFNSENDIYALKINYQVFVEHTDSLELYKFSLPYQEVHFVSSNKILSVQKFNDNNEGNLKIYDLEDENSFSCFVDNRGDKVAAREPFKNVLKIQGKKISQKKYQIAGMPCEVYEVTHQGKTLEMFTTDIFGIDFCPMTKSIGYALQYSYVHPQFGKVTYIATEVIPTKVANGLFSLEEFRIQRGEFETEKSNWNEKVIQYESSKLYDLYDKAINFKLRTFEEAKITSEEQKGKISILIFRGYLNFGAAERELYENLLKKYKEDKLNMFPVFYGSNINLNVLKQFSALGMTPVWNTTKLSNQFKINYFPTIVLLDKHNKVKFYRIGFNTELFEDLNAVLKEEL